VDDARAPRGLAGRLAARLRRGDDTSADDPATAPEPPQDPADEPLVSIVVPVYAVEQYVDECLRSPEVARARTARTAQVKRR